MAGIKSTRETDRGAVIIVDSMMMRPDALRQNPDMHCPQDILDLQVINDVSYIGFDRRLHKGQIVIDRRLTHDVQLFFELAQKIEFPIDKVAPAVLFAWDDTVLMDKNISSGFNFRTIAGTSEISLHAKGMAFDINPRNNPYIRYDNGTELVSPAGASYNLLAPGTLYADHPLVVLMKSHGWEWGGDWLPESGRVDYQHFQKNLDT